MRHLKNFGDFNILETFKGKDLVDLRYQPLFPYFQDLDAQAFRIIAGDFIEMDEGTGVVHIAPGFGEDDQRIADDNGIPTVVPVDDEGTFTEEITDWFGVNVLTLTH